MAIWHEILSLARHTPSPHNVQPWKFKLLDETKALLFIDKKRMLPKEDLTSSFILSAMSMMTESLALLAANRNYRLNIILTYQNQDTPLIPFAELVLIPDGTVVQEYPDVLFLSRHTSRLRYRKTLIPDSALQILKRLFEKTSQTFDCCSDQQKIEKMLTCNIDALFHDLNHPDYRDEITEYFRYNDTQAKKHNDGLDYRCMNLSKADFWLSAHTPQLLTTPFIKNILHWRYRKQIGPVATIGWICGPFWDWEESLNAGRMLIRFWLETARLGIYFHPFGNLVTNPVAAARVREELGVDNIWLIFKMGYSDVPPRSRRLPLKEIILD